MTQTTFLLILHLTGAFLIGFSLIRAVVALICNNKRSFRPLASQIAVGGFYQLVSGSLLTLISTQEQSVSLFCGKISIYLSLILIIEFLLLKRINQLATVNYPSRIVLTSLISGILVTVLTAFNL